MKRLVPLSLCVLFASLGLPSVAGAMAQPYAQDASRSPVDASASSRSRPPLFQVRYVLVSALPQLQPHDDPPLDFGDGKPAIRAVTLSGSPGVLLQGGVRSPSVIVCRGWSCMNSPRR